MLTCRLLQSSRAAMSSIVAVPASISDSQSRPRAIAVISLDRVSVRIGRVSQGALDALLLQAAASRSSVTSRRML
jgi:hypothetical protein